MKFYHRTLIFPQDAVKGGFSANDWIKSVVPVIDGKGGGKPATGQASGNNYTAGDEAIRIARQYAKDNLKISSSQATPSKDSKTSTSQSAPSLQSYSQILDLRLKIARNFSKNFKSAGDKEPTFFGNASSYFVAEDTFKAPGGGVFNAAKVLEWVNFADKNAWSSVNTALKSDRNSEKNLQSVLNYLNKVLEEKTFLVADRISLADVSVFTSLFVISTKLKNIEDTYVNFTRWFNTVLNHPGVCSVFS